MMEDCDTAKNTGSEPEVIRKSKRKPIRKDFEDFEVEMGKKSRFNEENSNSKNMKFKQNYGENLEEEDISEQILDSDENEDSNFEAEEVTDQKNSTILGRLKSFGTNEIENDNSSSCGKKMSVGSLMDIVESNDESLPEIHNISSIKSINLTALKKAPNTKRFRKEWLKMSEFKDWLQPHSLPDKAVCTICNKVLNAGKSELEKHGATRKHYNQLEQLRGLKIPFFDHRVKKSLSNLNNVSENNKTAISNKTVTVDSCDDLTIIKKPDPSPPVEIIITSDGDDNEDYEYEIEDNEAAKHYSNHNYSFNKDSGKEKFQESHPTKAFVSKLAPFWKASAIVNGHITELKLSDYRGRYVVLIFYPQDFSRVCQSELLSVSDRISEFRALNAEVVACSVDSYLAHQVWCRTPRSEGGLANPKIALLSDPTHSISKDYGCFMPELGHTLRAYYIIDSRGIIRQITINDIAVGRSTDELLRLVEAFQQTDETEACCPADWRSGQPLFS